MRGMLLGTVVAVLLLLIVGDRASNMPTITEERLCTEADVPDAFNSDAFNFGDGLPTDCLLDPTQVRSSRR